ncbi:MAG: LON peptidase substrate-binding domain-containing protein [Paracoccaceae bacterium]
MFNAADLPDAIPVFPLPGALLLPRSRLPLHIFEPRYLAMLDDTLKTSHRLVGMIQPLRSPAGDERLHSVGCAGRLTGFSETDDGRYMVTLTGVSRYRVKGEQEGFSAYRKCDVRWDGFERDLGGAEADPDFDRGPFMQTLSRYFAAAELKTDWESLRGADDELLINSLSMICPFEPEDRQALLEAPSLVERRKILVTLIEFALRGGLADEVMQ